MRKKKRISAQQRDIPEVQKRRRPSRRDMARVDPKRFVFVDESPVHTAMTRTHGRAPAGEPVHGAVPGSEDAMTFICGIRLSVVTAQPILRGATDMATFESDVEHLFARHRTLGDVVSWDNLQPHRAESVIRAKEAAQARVTRCRSRARAYRRSSRRFRRSKQGCNWPRPERRT
jgi:hypothetical protein